MESAGLGVILDSSVLIAGERRSDSVADVLDSVEVAYEKTTSALSAVTTVEMTRGIYRARTDSDRTRREAFVEELFPVVVVHPLTLEVARLAGCIYGEQMGRGVAIDVPDLIIGATALHLGFEVATLNVEHLRSSPGLSVAPL